MFEDKLKLYRENIIKELETFLLKFSNEDCKFVCKAMEYCLLSKGKLLRPILTLSVCEMFGCDYNKALAFACAIEFIHTGSLIHDDLPCMDDDSIRRGKAACHVKFNEATAVLAGDAFFSSAFEILVCAKDYGVNEEDVNRAVLLVSRMFGTKGIIGGQDMDMFVGFNCKDVNSTVEKIAKYKTCSLFVASCVLGAIAAGANDFYIKSIEKYAQYLGLCFQICDDILDYDSKDKEKNNKHEQINFVSVYKLEEAQKKQDIIMI